MCMACSALFRYNLKEVRICFSSSVYTYKNYSNLDFQTRSQPFSVQPLQEGISEFQIFSTDTRMLRVNLLPFHTDLEGTHVLCCQGVPAQSENMSQILAENVCAVD